MYTSFYIADFVLDVVNVFVWGGKRKKGKEK